MTIQHVNPNLFYWFNFHKIGTYIIIAIEVLDIRIYTQDDLALIL